jgi:hypothetical protein
MASRACAGRAAAPMRRGRFRTDCTAARRTPAAVLRAAVRRSQAGARRPGASAAPACAGRPVRRSGR